MPFFSETDRSVTLFSDRDLQTLLEDQSAQARRGVDSIDPERLLATPTVDLVEIVVSHCILNVPQLREDEIFQDQPSETWRDVLDYERIIPVRGFLYRFTVPFVGHLGLFRHAPALQVSSPSRATVVDGRLVFELAGYDLTAHDIKQELNKRISLIKRYLDAQEAMVTPFNAKLVSDTRTAIEARKNSILRLSAASSSE